jgi:hypothetical protein
MMEMGHLIANHTYNHPGLKYSDGRFAAKEILDTDNVIADATKGQLKLFRPPYFSWSANVAGRLNWTDAWPFIGAVGSDISADDWKCWRDGKDARACSAAYIKEIKRIGKGVILMHDNSFEDNLRLNSRTYEAVRIIVDWLQENDYKFVRADSLPAIRNASRISSVIALRAKNGCYISPQKGGGGKILVNSQSIGAWEPLGVVELGNNKIALRCLSGHYVSPQHGGGGKIFANGRDIGEWEVLNREDLGGGLIALRCQSGHYISLQNGGEKIMANSARVDRWEPLRVLKPSWS